ncbi:MAG TPA: DUF6629 family protein [Stellaceae bacterium]|nr:DUF6629 family protein [Stellaceae bacterium]
MCFSPTASFTTAGLTAVVGFVSLSRVNDPREIPLAATPLLFALQQALEGLLWIDLPLAPAGSLSTGLTLLFLFFAEVFWPIYAPTAALLVEPSKGRRRLMLLCLAAGVGIGAHFLWWILAHPHGAVILNGHIVYAAEYRFSGPIALAYLAATGLPLVLSSHRIVVALGAVILVGSAVAYVSYWEALVSVWCFFAAGASVLILGHFEWSRGRSHIARA